MAGSADEKLMASGNRKEKERSGHARKRELGGGGRKPEGVHLQLKGSQAGSDVTD